MLLVASLNFFSEREKSHSQNKQQNFGSLYLTNNKLS